MSATANQWIEHAATLPYRGHLLTVKCITDGALHGYELCIAVQASGAPRYSSVAPLAFSTLVAAQDDAYRSGRSWIDANPLPWPF